MNRLLQISAMITSAFVLVVVTSDVSLSREPPKSNPTTATKPKGPDNVTAPRSPTPAGPSRNSLGTRVITSLAAQLDGELDAASTTPGARFTLTFPLKSRHD